MCCFRLHFSDFIVLDLFKKNKKTCYSLLLKKNYLWRKKREKTCQEEKITAAPPPTISNGSTLKQLAYIDGHNLINIM